jgi:hypothetical protein
MHSSVHLASRLLAPLSFLLLYNEITRREKKKKRRIHDGMKDKTD